MKKEKSAYSLAQNLRFMLRYAMRYARRVLVLGALLVVLQVAANLIQLFIAPEILRRVETSAPLGELLGTIGVFTAALWAISWLTQYVSINVSYGRIEVRERIVMDINEKACETAYPNTLDPAVMKLKEKADDATNSNNKATEAIWTTLTDLAINVAGFVIYLILLRNLDPLLMLVVLLTTMAGFFAHQRAQHWRDSRWEKKAQYQKQINYILNKSQSIDLAKEVRLFDLGDWLRQLYDSTCALYCDLIAREESVALLVGVADLALNLSRNGIAYFYLLRMALGEGLPASQFLLYFGAVSGFTAWVTGILDKGFEVHRHSLELGRVQQYLNLPEPFRFEGGQPIPDTGAWELRMENVTFRYPGAEKDTIHGMNLTVRPGEKLAIVGLNGAGKTTLVKLLCGFYDPTEGRVLLNGTDIREFNRRDYYALFSAVFQEYSQLDVTVAQSVAQQVEGFDRQRVADCLEKAGLTRMVAELPQGMDTHVGRRVYLDGVQFSGGQTQRLMLARALYKDGPMLMLDEPTAALDPLAENDIYMKYNEMTRGKTSVFISHRLASTRFCDRIIFLRDGVIAEEGTHETLLKQGGGYAELFEVQSRYYREGRDF